MKYPAFLPAASIGIIGGADGSTAIFVTSTPDWWVLPLGLTVAAAALVGSIVLIRKHRKK